MKSYTFGVCKKDPVSVAVSVSEFLRENGVRTGVIEHRRVNKRHEGRRYVMMSYKVLGDTHRRRDPVYAWIRSNGNAEVSATVYDTIGTAYDEIIKGIESRFENKKIDGILPPS